MKGPIHQQIEARITAALSPQSLIVSNDSARHHGHAGDDGSGESHFSVTVVSAAFAGKSRVERQRLVNRAVGDLLTDNHVHAFAIRALTPEEGAQA